MGVGVRVRFPGARGGVVAVDVHAAVDCRSGPIVDVVAAGAADERGAALLDVVATVREGENRRVVRGRKLRRAVEQSIGSGGGRRILGLRKLPGVTRFVKDRVRQLFVRGATVSPK